MIANETRRYVPRFNRRGFSSRLNFDRRDHVAPSAIVSTAAGVSIVRLPRFIATVRKIRNCFGSTTLAAAKTSGDCRGQLPVPGRLRRSEFRLPATIAGCYVNRQRTFRPDG